MAVDLSLCAGQPIDIRLIQHGLDQYTRNPPLTKFGTDGLEPIATLDPHAYIGLCITGIRLPALLGQSADHIVNYMGIKTALRQFSLQFECTVLTAGQQAHRHFLDFGGVGFILFRLRLPMPSQNVTAGLLFER